MKNTTERRQEILEFLCQVRHTNLISIMQRFGISRATAIRDIQLLSCSYPIFTTVGGGGGIHMSDGFRLGKKYLTDDQVALLDKLSYGLTGEELLTMEQILKTFKNPITVNKL